MKLQADGGRREEKGLVAAGRALGQVNRAVRQIEGVAVPVKGAEALGKNSAQGRCAGIGRAADRMPTDLLVMVLIHLGAEGIGHELGPQADAEHFFTGAQHVSDETLLLP